MVNKNPVRVGIEGPFGSGKTTLIAVLCKNMRDNYQIAVITNDLCSREDQRILITSGALESNRIIGIETGRNSHAIIREDTSMNFIAIEKLIDKFNDLDIIFIESSGDNFSSVFSPELTDLNICVIDVFGREKIQYKNSPDITSSDFLVINKIDLAPYVGVSLSVMEKDTNLIRRGLPWVFTNLKIGVGYSFIISFIIEKNLNKIIFLILIICFD